jgi:hypothetical protein
MPPSSRSEAALVRAIADEGHSEIGIIALELGLDGRAVGGNRLDRALSLIRAVKAEQAPDVAARTLIDLAQRLLASYNEWQIQNSQVAAGLRRALELDGYLFQDGRLVPTAPGAVAIEPLISSLETQLAARGFNVALRHYQQAVDTFTRSDFEAANSQTRSFLEDLFIQLCSEHTGREFNDAGAALQHARNARWLDDGEWNHIRHFWADIQDNGPHRGLSSPDEALFRLHYATAVARYLLTKAAV